MPVTNNLQQIKTWLVILFLSTKNIIQFNSIQFNSIYLFHHRLQVKSESDIFFILQPSCRLLENTIEAHIGKTSFQIRLQACMIFKGLLLTLFQQFGCCHALCQLSMTYSVIAHPTAWSCAMCLSPLTKDGSLKSAGRVRNAAGR